MKQIKKALVFSLITILGVVTPVFAKTISPSVLDKPITNEEIELPYELKRACGCESSGSSDKDPRQFTLTGNPITNKNNNGSIDWGACQINDESWDSAAIELNIDYKNSLEDNYKLAIHIYENEQGIDAWKYSYDPLREKCLWEKNQ